MKGGSNLEQNISVLLVKIFRRLGLEDEKILGEFNEFLQSLYKSGYEITIIKSKIYLYYKEYGISSLQIEKNEIGFFVSINKFQQSNKKLIQVEKKYFNKYWIDNIPKKQFRLDKHRDEELKQLELIYEQIKEVFFDDIVVDFRINAIGFKDYRCFKDEKFKFNKQSTVLLGKNASGKTTLLDGIAVAIGGFLSGIDEKTDSKTITKDDIRFNLYEEENVLVRDDYPPTILQFKTKFMSQEIVWSRARNSLTSSKVTKKEANKIVNIVRQLVEDTRESKKERKIILPLFSYHGTGRVANFTKDMGLLQKTERISRFVGYKDCLKPASNYKFFLAWYRKMKLRAFELQTSISSLDAVTNSITECLKLLTQEENRKVEKILFLEGLIHIKYDDGEMMPISYLSDGYQDVIGIISDIAFRAAILNPHLGENILKETPGIVLIDEVDLHLHPRWQQKILFVLKTIFPKVQFITTTHSALIISTTEENEAFEIKVKDERIITEPVGTPRDWYISDILANVFHVPKKPLYVTNTQPQLDLNNSMQQFSNMVKEYLVSPDESMLNKINTLYEHIIPSLPENSSKRRAIDSLKGLIR